MRALLIAVAGAAAAVAVIALKLRLHTESSLPNRNGLPVSILEDYNALTTHPVRVLQILRSLGVGLVQLPLPWARLAANPGSHIPPETDPYPQPSWAVYDAIDRDAARLGIRLGFMPTGGAPAWATAAGAPPRDRSTGVWYPSARAFGRFVSTAGARYDGHYTPPGANSPLPAVRFWDLWDEPNWGASLQPQLALNPLRIASAPEYRRLLDAAWSALQGTGHGGDTIVIGNLSPRGTTPTHALLAAASYNAGPLGFTRALYCVDASYRPLRGNAAASEGCPTSAAASKRFRQQHPVLFRAQGFGIHPYPVNLPPTEADTDGTDTVEFSQIPHLIATLDRIDRVYRSRSRIGVWITEYGYVTHPPNAYTYYPSPERAGLFLNWTEYLVWRNPRIESTMQYQLFDPAFGPSPFGPGGFATGLASATGKPKATFYAYRMPIFLPRTHAARGSGLEVWGCARPAPYAYTDTHRPQYVQIQLSRQGSGPFRTVRSVRLDSGSCYFDVRVTFPASGTVRLAWSYPADDPRLQDPLAPRQRTIYSRSVAIRVG